MTEQELERETEQEWDWRVNGGSTKRKIEWDGSEREKKNRLGWERVQEER